MTNPDRRDIRQDYKNSYIERYDALVESGNTEEAEKVRKILADNYSYDVDTPVGEQAKAAREQSGQADTDVPHEQDPNVETDAFIDPEDREVAEGDTTPAPDNQPVETTSVSASETTAPTRPTARKTAAKSTKPSDSK